MDPQRTILLLGAELKGDNENICFFRPQTPQFLSGRSFANDRKISQDRLLPKMTLVRSVRLANVPMKPIAVDFITIFVIRNNTIMTTESFSQLVEIQFGREEHIEKMISAIAAKII